MIRRRARMTTRARRASRRTESSQRGIGRFYSKFQRPALPNSEYLPKTLWTALEYQTALSWGYRAITQRYPAEGLAGLFAVRALPVDPARELRLTLCAAFSQLVALSPWRSPACCSASAQRRARSPGRYRTAGRDFTCSGKHRSRRDGSRDIRKAVCRAIRRAIRGVMCRRRRLCDRLPAVRATHRALRSAESRVDSGMSIWPTG